jgi:hypothetical protein
MTVRIPSILKQASRCLLGDRRYESLAEFYLRARAEMNPRYQAGLRRIKTLKDKHRGERCFIIGNGPSLENTDLSLLKDEITFGTNRIYLLFDKVGFATTYYVSVNSLVIEQCARDIAGLPCPKFISWDTRHLIDFTADMMFLRSRTRPTFFTDITKGVWEGATVTYVAMQIAYYLGFRNVILVGVDHSFATQGKPHTVVESQGDDPDHFAPEYFGKGFRWQLPDLECSELAYRLAKNRFESDGGEIVDATVGGKLQVFRKVDYQTLFT